MYYDSNDGKIRVYHITKALLERRGDSTPELKKIFERRLLDEQIQDLNTLYVACTRAECELYNLVITQKREGPISRLFDEVEAGQRKQAAGRGREAEEAADPTPAIVPPARASEEVGKEEEIWSLSRQQEQQEGEFYHRVLEQIEFLAGSWGDEIFRLLARCQAQEAIIHDLPRIQSELARFLAQPQVKDWFSPLPGRRVMREAEYVDPEGQLHRMDRVVLDPGLTTVIDFKTKEKKDDEGRLQVRGYMEILSQVYPGSKIEGYLAYVDSGKVKRIE
jgi:ATP-dependent exoDNAse (exonuclease V) beta subunit